MNGPLHKYILQKVKVQIKPKFSKDIIRPPLVIFSAFLKKNYNDKIKSFSKSKWTGLILNTKLF